MLKAVHSALDSCPRIDLSGDHDEVHENGDGTGDYGPGINTQPRITENPNLVGPDWKGDDTIRAKDAEDLKKYAANFRKVWAEALERAERQAERTRQIKEMLEKEQDGYVPEYESEESFKPRTYKPSSQAGKQTVLEEIRKRQVEMVREKFGAESPEALAREVRILAGEWIEKDGMFMLMDGDRAVTGPDGAPIRVYASTVAAIGEQSRIHADVSCGNGLNLLDIFWLFAMNEKSLSRTVSVAQSAVGSVPETSRVLNEGGKVMMEKAEKDDTLYVRHPDGEALPAVPEGFTPEQFDQMLRLFYEAGSNPESVVFEGKAGELLGDKYSRTVSSDLHDTALADGSDVLEAIRDAVERGRKGWLKGKNVENLAVAKICKDWQYNWTHEYADMLLSVYQRKISLLDMYRRCVPEGVNLLDHMQARARELDLGEGNDLLEFVAGKVAAAGVGLLTANPFAGAAAVEVGTRAAGAIIQGLDIDSQNRQSEDLIQEQK